MKIMVNLENTDEYQELDINENLSILDLKANLSTIFNFSWNEMELILNGNTLANQLILGQIKFNDDVVILRRVPSNLALSRSFSSSSQRSGVQPSTLGQAFSQFMNNQRREGGIVPNYSNNNYNNSNPLAALLGGFRSNAKEQFIQKRVKELHDRFLTSPDDLNNLFNTNPDLAEAISKLIETDYYGIYHITNSESCSWCEFAKYIFEVAGKDVKVIPVTASEFARPAPRPHYSVLENKKWIDNGFEPLRSYKVAIKEYIGLIK